MAARIVEFVVFESEIGYEMVTSLTCVSFSCRALAISMRRARVKYLLKWNSFSNSVNCLFVKFVRPELLLLFNSSELLMLADDKPIWVENFIFRISMKSNENFGLFFFVFYLALSLSCHGTSPIDDQGKILAAEASLSVLKSKRKSEDGIRI